VTKYRAQPIEVDGIRFASRREARRYEALKLLVRAGEIVDLELQPSWTFEVDGRPLVIRSAGYPNGRRVRYVADFAYQDLSGGYVVEDAKGMQTPAYKLKRALMELHHGIVVREV